MKNSNWITPILRQCFVTSGVFFNMINSSLVMGFSFVLLIQLSQPDSTIQINDSTAYWIATLPAITVIVGNSIAPPIMGRSGRKVANLISLCISIAAWLCILLSRNVAVLLVGRFLNGVSVGMIFTLGPVLIGEYTSPRNRGVFLVSLNVSLAIGTASVYFTAYILRWQITTIICIGIAVLNLLIVILSPESPMFLAGKGKYDECRKVFRYLRGDSEDDELEKMIAASKITRENEYLETRQTCGVKLEYFLVTIRKEGVYKPILIMIHLFIMALWSGANTLILHPGGLIANLDWGFNIYFTVITLQLNRLVASFFGLIVMKWIKRRKILYVVVSINIAINLSIAVYSFIRGNFIVGEIYASIPLILVHIQMFVVTIGAMPLSFVLAGELYPMEHKCLCAGIGTIFLSIITFINLKTVSLMFETIGVFGLYLINFAITAYCMLILGSALPETKDKTLQDIEEEFKEKKKTILVVNKTNK